MRSNQFDDIIQRAENGKLMAIAIIIILNAGRHRIVPGWSGISADFV
tara:strand:+ start:7328 stop:7468 length:141 start_codon:yes stop_codon:yes gene_type:complete